MHRRIYTPLCVTLLLLAACAPPAPLPTLAPTAPPPTPTLVPTPTPVPTATPIPPLQLTIQWPGQVSALQPVPIAVELLPPAGVAAAASVRVAVRAPGNPHYWEAELLPRGGALYAAEESLQLPLEPPEGNWRLLVYAQSDLRIEGERELVFRPAPIQFREWTDDLPTGARMRVPLGFTEVAAQGDQTAGMRVWQYEDGQVSLWWAPGPTEPLLLNNAIVMLEATYGIDAPDEQGIEETEWAGQTAFLVHENWPGPEGGPAEALVAQGPDYWLYVVRVRVLGGEAIPALSRMVWETFQFSGE